MGEGHGTVHPVVDQGASAGESLQGLALLRGMHWCRCTRCKGPSAGEALVRRLKVQGDSAGVAPEVMRR